MSTTHRRSNPGSHPSRLSQAIQGVLLASALTASVAAHGEETTNRKSYHISGGSLGQALSQFARDAGILFTGESTLTDGKTSKGLDGEYSVEEGFRKLLAGSGLTYRISADNSVALKVAESGSDGATMPAVTVTGKAVYDDRSSDYNRTKTALATKTDTPLMETPMSVQVVPQQVLKDQQAIRMEDALKNVSGVVTGYGFGALEDTFIIRGFENSTNSWSLTEVYRDGALVVEGLFSLADVESVEVLKGPAAMLYGRLQPGGLINVTTKRPQKQAAYSIEQQFGSFDTYRTTTSATGALSSDGNLTYRVDFEYLDKDSFRDFAFNQQTFLSPKLSWQIGDKTRIDLDYVHFDQDAFTDWGLPVLGKRVAPVPIGRSFQEPGNNYFNRFDGGGLTLNHSFNDAWQFQGKFFKYSETYGGPDHSPGALNAATGLMARSFYDEVHKFDSIFGMANLTGKFATSGLDHTLLLGWDYFDSGFNEDGVSLSGANGIAAINIYDPIYGQGVQNAAGRAINSSYQIEDGWYGFYLQDQIKFAKDWHLLLGFRHDDAESSQSFVANRSDYLKDSDGEFSPRFGLLYHPLDWLSVYGSYVEGYHHSNIGRSNSTTNLLPEKSHQFEAGLKGEWWDGKLTSTVTFYDLTKENVTVPDQNPLLALQGYVEQLGAARSRGAEFDLSGQLSEDWRVIASYAFTDARITRDQGYSGATLTSGNQGNRLPNVPEYSGSFWVQHDFNELGWRGLSGGIGVYYAGEREGNRTNSFQLPGYARLDSMLRYSRKIADTKLSVQFNAQNLTDEEYFVAARNARSVTPAVPLNFVGSVRLEF